MDSEAGVSTFVGDVEFGEVVFILEVVVETVGVGISARVVLLEVNKGGVIRRRKEERGRRKERERDRYVGRDEGWEKRKDKGGNRKNPINQKCQDSMFYFT